MVANFSFHFKINSEHMPVKMYPQSFFAVTSLIGLHREKLFYLPSSTARAESPRQTSGTIRSHVHFELQIPSNLSLHGYTTLNVLVFQIDLKQFSSFLFAARPSHQGSQLRTDLANGLSNQQHPPLSFQN